MPMPFTNSHVTAASSAHTPADATRNAVHQRQPNWSVRTMFAILSVTLA
jgi:hypothetical protein